jgi:vacuolar-type H+-ATPase subunit H
LLERLRRMQPAPGAAARVMAVPSAGDELSREVAGLFPALDEVERRANALVAAARSDAGQTEAAAVLERRRILAEAEAESQQVAAGILAARRAAFERQAAATLADAAGEAERVLARGRRQTPKLAREIVERVLAGDR